MSVLAFMQNPLECDCSDCWYVGLANSFGSDVRPLISMARCTGKQFPNQILGEFDSSELYCDVFNGCPDGCACKEFSCKQLFEISCNSPGTVRNTPVVVPSAQRYNLTMNRYDLSVLVNRDYYNKYVAPVTQPLCN